MVGTDIPGRLTEAGIVPVIAIERVEWALPLADALLAGGLRVIEITFRTSAAAEVIRTLSAERPQLTVGAGTVLTLENLDTAKANGAKFGVAPGLNPTIARRAQQLQFPFFPGVATPTEIDAALELGCRLLKFFPSEALGGCGMLAALFAPYQHTGVRFMPTGGVNPGNLENYLKCDAVAAVGGTWIAKREDFVTGNWSEITQRCRAAVTVVKKLRNRE